MPVNVLHIVYQLGPGGVETIIRDLVGNADRRRVAMDVLVHAPVPGHYDDEVREAGARILVGQRPGSVRGHLRRFREILASAGPYQVVHAHHHVWGHLLGVAARHAIPIRISHVHNDLDLAPVGNWRERFYDRLGRILSRRFATTCLAVSEVAAKSFFGPQWQQSSQCRIWISGHDFRGFAQPVDAAAVRADLGLPPAARTVVHVGRFDRQKNHRFLLQVFAAARQSDPRLRLLLVGEGALRPAAEQWSRDLGITDAVHFLGVRRDIPRILLGAADVFVFPSDFEGLPGALIEAQAAGLPCLVSTAVARESEMIPELVTRLSLKDSPVVWAEHLQQVLQAPRVAAAAAYARAVNSSFDIHQSLPSLYRVYGVPPVAG